MNERETNDSTGFSGTSLLLMFLGGALVGAATVYLAQADNRARIRALATNTSGQLSQALRNATQAASQAFIDSHCGNPETKR